MLSANTAAKDHTFWADDALFSKVCSFTEHRLIGHQQGTEPYLLGRAVRRGGALATLNESIAELPAPDSPERDALVIVV